MTVMIQAPSSGMRGGANAGEIAGMAS